MKQLKYYLTAASALFVSSAFADQSLPGGPQVNGIDFQHPVTSIARDERDLNYMVMLICLAIGILVFGVMFYSVFKHRKSKGAVAAQFHESTAVEVAWTVVPLLIVIAMVIPATKTVVAQQNVSDSYMTVKVTGYQWKWGYEYMDGPGKGISFYSTLTTPMSEVFGDAPKPNDYLLQVDHPLVVPVDKKIRILTTSMDVLHGWYVPSFGVQMDAIPGFIRETWFKAEQVGTYYGQCAQVCGRGHAFMPIVVKVLSQPDYEAWVKSEEVTLKKNGGALAPSGATS
ncbi:cytochrome c oxidase subunit 2 precursor [mine drainage metagenome]|uniref:cytochrome-c oxidase n=1 Tax=mine drainage metagenome TaxID=410659 RepID=A0A1J5RQ75_9ZZZZ